MVVLFTAVLSVLAQRTITGTVIDSDEQQGVIQATVALLKADSAIVANGVISDKKARELGVGGEVICYVW